MAGSLEMAKTLLVPALISLAAYFLLFFLLIPFIRRYRQRYAQYLPLHTVSAHASSLRERASDALMHFLLPSSWRQRQIFGAHNDGGSVFDDEEGEDMVGFEIDSSRREALEHGRRSGGDNNHNDHSSIDTERRLSRDLEEGFMDDSDDEDGDDMRARVGGGGGGS
ncbi:hypothetical protein I7I51_02303 [Histoplasma capsulatum]|uniref:Checkpoint protein hus1 n=1 Tax=Ajellomyces capsulatus TaxID=5037 RepID=A0A8A1M9X3_AJECA|nr:conserved hypothetical protein [Histoplasma mississippiense (nom. inval.)]EDN09680.1 conserved hypothetical protein [Histoplasma mississippiense (nom. inval.)]QSS62565.1 hypothetical protein I7I51_02303 [Histoplasma capsulatum]